MATLKSETITTPRSLKIVLIAGEDSGDLLGASLMQAIQKQSNRPVEFHGLGGAKMVAKGLQPFFPIDGLNLLGLVEIVGSLWMVKKKLNQAVDAILQADPDVVVTIDLPGFNKRLAKKLQAAQIKAPLIHYVAPTVWAWRPSRAQKFKKLFDKILCLYPFEEPYFNDENTQQAVFTGHPLVFSAEIGVAERFHKKHKTDPSHDLIALLPGSRKNEVERLLPVYKEVVLYLQQKKPNISVVIPVVAHLKDKIQKEVCTWPVPVYIVAEEGRSDAYAACAVALAASGTVALELARAKLPMIIAYKVSWLTAVIARRLLKIKFACLLNILAGKEIVPEFLQERCVPEAIALKLLGLIESQKQRDRQIKNTQESLTLLKGDNHYASERAAQEVLESALNKA